MLDLDDGGDVVAGRAARTRARRRGCGARRRRRHQQRGRRRRARRASVWALATSHGFAGGYAATSYGISASVLAGEGGGDGARLCLSHAPGISPHLEDAATRSAAAPASARSRGSIPAGVPSGAMPVVFDPRVGVEPARPSGRRDRRPGDHAQDQLPARRARRRACSRTACTIARRSAPPARAALAPVRRRGAAGARRSRSSRTACSKPGCSTAPRRGSSGWSRPAMPRAASAAAGRFDQQPLYGSRASCRREALIGDIERGVYVTELIGMGVNGVTGDYQPRRGRLPDREWRDHARRSPNSPSRAISRTCSSALTPANDLEFRYGDQRADAAHRRDDGGRWLTRWPMPGRGDRRAEAGALAMARWRTDFRRWEKIARQSGLRGRSRGRRVAARAAVRRSMPEAGWLSEETIDNAERLAQAAAVGGRSDRRHARLSARAAPAGRCRSRWSRTASR